MKKFAIIFFAFAGLMACKEDKEDTQSQETAMEVDNYTIEQFMDNESVSNGSFSRDNSKLLVSSNRTGIYNLYSVPVSGGEFTPITESDSTSMFARSYFPNDDRILYSADGNGDEIDHLYVIDSTGQSKDITPWEGAKSSFYGWSDDDQYLYFGSNKRDSKYFDVYKMNVDNYETEVIYEDKEGMVFTGMSNDEKYIAVSKSLNTNDSDLFLINTETDEKIKLNDSLSGNSAQAFSKDNSKFYYTTDDGEEFSYLMSYDLNTKEKKVEMKKDWDIAGMGFSKEGSYMTVFINEDGKNTIEVYDTESGDFLDLPDFGNASITGVSFSADEKMMRLNVGGSNMPSNMVTYNLETKEKNQITDVLNDEIKPEHLVEARVVRYKSFDGVEIPAIYYLPHQASKNNKVPGMIWVHGGPGGQTRQNFSSLIQYVVNNGYAVLAVNNRGSSGYGKSFYKMDDLNHGEKDLQDCVEGKNWLAEQPEIDGDKIGIIGGSYGGYMTMAALTFTPEEFDVGVNIFGVTNWLRTLKSIPPYWESFRESLYLELGDPYSADSVRLREISPLFHTDKVTKPLIVLQGAKDPRVLQVESDEIVEGVRKNGVPVEYVLFEDEGHGFVKKENQIEAYGKIVEFLDTHLKNKDKPVDGQIQDTEIDVEETELEETED